MIVVVVNVWGVNGDVVLETGVTGADRVWYNGSTEKSDSIAQVRCAVVIRESGRV